MEMVAAPTVDARAARDLLLTKDHSYLDVRTEEEFKKGHVHGALNVPFLFFRPEGKVKNPQFLEEVSAKCSKEQLLVVGCASGVRSALAANALLEAGYLNVKNMGGGFGAWVENGFDVAKPCVETSTPTTCMEASVTNVDVHAAKDLIHTDHRYLDVRTVEEFNKGHVHGAINIPYLFFTQEGRVKNPNFLEQISGTYSKDDLVIVGCASGNRSFHACKDLITVGFKHVKNMEGGYTAWVENGFLVNLPEIAVPSAA